MKQFIISEILSNYRLSSKTLSIELYAPEISSSIKPGQFLQLYVDSEKLLLPRPIALCEAYPEKGSIRLVYEIVGEGTTAFSLLQPGDKLKIFGPLGNGYTINEGKNQLLLGGGAGAAPLLALAREMAEKTPDSKVTAVLGFDSEYYMHDEFEKAGAKVIVCTEAGSYGVTGNVIHGLNTLKESFDYAYACGTKGMLRAVSSWADEKGLPIQVSLDERMACGIGACVGCVVKIKNNDGWENKRVCADGPVFLGEEVIWE